MRKDFVQVLPREISLDIFLFIGFIDDAATLCRAARVCSEWYCLAEYQLIQTATLPRFISVNMFDKYIATCKNVIAKLGVDPVIKRMFVVPSPLSMYNVVEKLMCSGLLVELAEFVLRSPSDLTKLVRTHKKEVEAFVRHTKVLTVTFWGPDDADGLDVLFCNAECVNVNFQGPAEKAQFRERGVKSAPYLEEIWIQFPGETVMENALVDSILQRYDAPKLMAVVTDGKLSKKSLRKVFTNPALERINLTQAFTTLRSLVNSASSHGARLKRLCMKIEMSVESKRAANMEDVDFRSVSNLGVLDVEGTYLTATGILNTAKATRGNLYELQVGTGMTTAFDKMGEDYWEDLLRSCPQLKLLAIRVCNGFGDQSLKMLRRAIDKVGKDNLSLKRLDFSACPLTEAGVRAFFQYFPLHLLSVDLSSNQISHSFENELKEKKYSWMVYWNDNNI